ncbi:MAG: sensor histidine kinase, partial [Acidimicrobiales bacterium]
TGRMAQGDLAARIALPAGADSEVVSLASSINLLAASLERSRAAERDFLLSVSHDLRTPLTSIRGYAEALADGQAPDPTQAASVILSEARRLERLVQDLLELARLGARHFSLNVRPIDAAEVVGRAADGFRPAAERAGVTLTVHTDGPATVDADGDRLGQIVANLVENALKYAATRIDIRVRPGVEIVIEDDGPGIAPDDAAHVFEPFFRSTRAPTREVGTGLGLAIVRELVEAMGGTVRADGTRMAVAIPGRRAGRGAA